MYKLFCNIYRFCVGFLFDFLSNKGKKFKQIQPTLLIGDGITEISETAVFGVIKSPGFYSYGYIESRDKNSKILIRENVVISNCCKFIAFRADISIGSGCLIGLNCTILTSDFHNFNGCEEIKCGNVTIEEGVFIGNDVTILKNVTIGKGSIIGAGSVVTNDVPEMVVFAGNPGRVIRKL